MTSREVTSPTVLILSPYFPPSTLAGVHRARLLAKHLPRHGWEPIVLCVDEAYHEQRLDPSLAKFVPSETEIVKVAALPIGLTRRFGIGEISLRAWVSFRRALFELLTTRKIDLVMITGSPFYPMLLALAIKKRFCLPVVLDFQDPWVSAWGAQQKRWSKAGLAHALAIWLEPRAVRCADFITSVSENQNAEMAARYPWLDPERMAAIPIGGDPEDFKQLRLSETASATGHLDPQRINLSYVGSFWPAAEPSIRAVFRGFSKLRDDDRDLAKRIRLNFIGTDPSLSLSSSFAVMPLAEEEGVADSVYEVPHRVPYLEALSILAHSDGLLLIGSDERHYTASKIYPALMSGTPYLSLFHSASSAHRILTEAGGGVALSFGGPDEQAGKVPALADALRQLATAPESLRRGKPTLDEAFSASAIARAYTNIFDQLGRGQLECSPDRRRATD